MKRISVAIIVAFFLGIFYVGAPGVNAAPPPPPGETYPPGMHPGLPVKILNIVGSWRGTGWILAPFLDEQIDVVLNITTQSGFRFFGTMEISLAEGILPGIMEGPGHSTSFTCPIAGNITAKEALTITGAAAQSFANSTGGTHIITRNSFLTQEITGSLIPTNPRRIQGDFRVAVHWTDVSINTFKQIDNLNPGSGVFCGSFNLEEMTVAMEKK